jgi:hypothetical protein
MHFLESTEATMRSPLSDSANAATKFAEIREESGHRSSNAPRLARRAARGAMVAPLTRTRRAKAPNGADQKRFHAVATFSCCAKQLSHSPRRRVGISSLS